MRLLGSELVKAPMDLLLRAGSLSIEDVYEVRTVLEVRIAEIAAERAHPSDMEAMEETIRSIK